MSKHVVIGEGFAGINLAKHLAGKAGLRVTLVDRNNYNFFVPLLYQVATGLLEVSSISTPFRTLFKGVGNLRFRLGEFRAVDPGAKKVRLSSGVVDYDELVIATGTRTNFFGMGNIARGAAASLPLFRQRRNGDHRQEQGRGRPHDSARDRHRLRGLDDVALRSPLRTDRLSQPHQDDVELDERLLHPRPVARHDRTAFGRQSSPR